ncbi:protein smoothened-like [Lineus longissimus]|uniref:protein smoothened-like n=1 Tax=Lineus longissimus TaxID=88925 RepID=UPI00315C5EA7
MGCSWMSLAMALTVSISVATVPAGDENQCGTQQIWGTCEPIPSGMKCLGVQLPYTETSLVYANDSTTLENVQEKLILWSALKNVPQCWAVIQPFLCAVYMPSCNSSVNQTDNSTITKVSFVSKELCELTRGPCKIVSSTRGWPSFLQCDRSYFKAGCKSPVDGLEFNKTSTCERPLVKTPNPSSWYEAVEGCGIQCQNPLFTQEEHDHVHIFIAVWGTICLLCTLFTVLTFLIDWKNASRYPALILFFINVCFFLGSVGWLAQFGPGARDDIVCRRDGTMRTAEPQVNNGESASCTIVFFIVYFFMMAGVTWFVVLAFAWHLTFKALGTPRDEVDGKTAYFHITAWSFPLVLTIICLAITEVDGDSVSGICFVGYINHGTRAGLVLVPVGMALTAGLFFLIKGLVTLIRVRQDCPSVISGKATSKIRETIIRIGSFTSLAFIFVFATFAVHVYIFTQEADWQLSFKEYVICEANVTVANSLTNQTTTCHLRSRPNLSAMMVHIFSYFGAGIAMSSWVWTKATISAWGRFFRKIFHMPQNKPVKLKKHKMIARAFAKRRELQNGSRMSVSFVSTHDDPVGMKFDLNSAGSQSEMSSTWAANVPKLVRRRGGMMHPVAGTLRRYSDSDIQSMASYMSRRTSVDSQASEQDQEPEKKPRKKKRKNKKRARKIQPVDQPLGFIQYAGINGQLVGGAISNAGFRRGSDVSVSSHASSVSFQVSIDNPGQPHPRPPARLPALNTQNLTNFSIFTASSFMPKNTPDSLGLSSHRVEKSCSSSNRKGLAPKRKFKKPSQVVEDDVQIDVDDLSFTEA